MTIWVELLTAFVIGAAIGALAVEEYMYRRYVKPDRKTK